jgi:hypothetical protein
MGNTQIYDIATLKDLLEKSKLDKEVKLPDFKSVNEELDTINTRIEDAEKDIKELKRVKPIWYKCGRAQDYKIRELELKDRIKLNKDRYNSCYNYYNKLDKKYRLALKHNENIRAQIRYYTAMINVLTAKNNITVLKAEYNKNKDILSQLNIEFYTHRREVDRTYGEFLMGNPLEYINAKYKMDNNVTKYKEIYDKNVNIDTLIKNLNRVVKYNTKYAKAVKTNCYASGDYDAWYEIDNFNRYKSKLTHLECEISEFGKRKYY